MEVIPRSTACKTRGAEAEDLSTLSNTGTYGGASGLWSKSQALGEHDGPLRLSSSKTNRRIFDIKLSLLYGNGTAALAIRPECLPPRGRFARQFCPDICPESAGKRG
jgi:hypothetical protein